MSFKFQPIDSRSGLSLRMPNPRGRWKESSLKAKPSLKDMDAEDKKMHVVGVLKEKKNIRDEFSAFFTETSFTAIVKIYKAKSILKRLAWTALVLSMVSWLGVQCFWLLDKYFSYPMEVKLDLKASTELEFPSVTICNLNPIREQYVHQHPFTALAKYSQPDTSDLLYQKTLQNWQFQESCVSDQWQCSNGRCIPISYVCDGVDDCNNNNDEESCHSTSCPTGYFRCPTNGRCITSVWKCDNYNDCPDGADEVGCPGGSGGTGSTPTSGMSYPPHTPPSGTGMPTRPPTTPPRTTGSGFPSPPPGRKKRFADEENNMLLHSKSRNHGHTGGHQGKSENEIISQHSADTFRKMKTQWVAMKKRVDAGEITMKQYEDFVSFQKSEIIRKNKMKEQRRQGKFHVDGPRSRKKRQVRNPADKSSIDIDWSALLQNSTFNKWDSLDSDINVTSKYYDSVDDELEAYLTYAYITAPMDPAVVEMAGHKKKDFIASCKFGGFQCSPRNFTYFHSHRYGNCYTFNHKDSDKVLFSKFSGPDLGLRLELFIEQSQYVANLATEAGARVLIHKRGSMPFPEDDGISVMPGRSTSVGMRQIRISRLPPNHGVCSSEGKIEDFYVKHFNTEYSKLSCSKSCYQMIIMEFCACAVPFYFVPQNVTICNMTDTVTAHCVNRMPSSQTERYQECDKSCPLPCEETRYDLSISMAQWPSEKFEDFLAQRLVKVNALYLTHGDDSDEQFTKLQIYYQDLLFEHIEQQKAYESMNLISDLGGQLGLWLGLSAITIGELCSFFFSVGQTLFPLTGWGNRQKQVHDNSSSGAIQPATLEEMYEDMYPAAAKYVPPDIVTTKTDHQASTDA